MNGEYYMEQENGDYDLFRHMVKNGELDEADIQELYDELLISEEQYKFGMEYLTED